MITAPWPAVRWTDAKRDGTGRPPRYQLQLSLPAPYHVSQTQHVQWSSEADAKQPLLLPVTAVVPSNLPVMAQLYVWRESDTGVMCMYRAAHAEMTIRQLVGGGEFTMGNVKGDPQAVLSLQDVRSTVKFSPPVANWKPIAFPPKMSTDVMAAGLPPNGRVSHRFLRDQVPHMYGPVPVWMLCMMYEEDLDRRVTEGYLRNALFHSVRICGFKDEQAWMAQASAPTPVYWEVLATVCMFNVRYRPYLYDETWKQGRGMVGFDQFSAIEAAPDVKNAAGDCEDDALSIDLIAVRLHQIRYSQYKADDPLRHLARLSHGFCCVTVDVSINVDGKKMPENPADDDPALLSLHHLAMLIPWSTMARLAKDANFAAVIAKSKGAQVQRTRGWPTLSLEGTETSRGNCTQDPDAHIAFKRYCVTMRKTCGLDVLKKAHVDSASLQTFDTAKFYRQVIAMYSPDLYRLFSIGMLAVCADGGVGVDWKQFVTCTSTSQRNGDDGLSLAVSKIASDRDAETLTRLCARAPKLARLDVSTAPTEYTSVSGDGVYTLVFRDQDLTNEEERTLLALIEACKGYTLKSNQRIHVTDEFIVRLFQFVATAAAP